MNPTNLQRIACSLLALIAAPHLHAQGYPVHVLMQAGDSVPGVGKVTAFLRLAVNDSGEWIAEVDTDNLDTGADQVLLRDGLPVFREGQALPEPAGATLAGFVKVGLDNDGNTVLLLDHGNVPAAQNSGVWFNQTALLLKGSDTTAGGLPPGSPFTWFLSVVPASSHEMLVAATVDDPTLGGSYNHVLLRVATAADDRLLSESVVARAGDLPDGEEVPISRFGSDLYEPSIGGNTAGQSIYFAELQGADTGGVLFLDGTKVAGESEPSPLPSRDYLGLRGRAVDLNAWGDWVLSAVVDGESTTDDLLVLNGETFVRESQTLDDIAPYVIFGPTGGPFGHAHRTAFVDDSRNVIWTGAWDSPAGGTLYNYENTGIFLNTQLLARESVTDVDGTLLNVIYTGSENFAASDNGRFVMFVAKLAGLSTLLWTEVAPPSPVPDGRVVPGTQARASRAADGLGVDVTWDVASCPAADYHLFVGDLASVSSPLYEDAVCNLGPSGVARFTPTPGDKFWIIVGVDQENRESSHGFDSDGAPREASAGGLCRVSHQVRISECRQ